jgi:hypothetical protein
MKRREKGQAILEAALMLPLLVFLALGMITLQWDLSVVGNLEYVVNETARCEAIKSYACTSNSATVAYAQGLAANLRIQAASLQLTVPPCSIQTCTVTATYTFITPGRWFPALTVTRVGTAAVAPPQ